MYDLPQNVSLDFLVGRELELVCFGAYVVTLHFSGGPQIQIEGGFEHGSAADREIVRGAFPLSESQLMRLITHRVTTIEARPNGTLTLVFSNDDRLTIDGNVGPYESYQVSAPDRELLVV